MVTRNILKNTPTQVNSHLIGVRNLPEVTNVKFDIYYKTARTVYGDVYYINNKPYKRMRRFFTQTMIQFRQYICTIVCRSKNCQKFHLKKIK